MSRRKRDKQFNENLQLNQIAYSYYLDRLTELGLIMFDWKNLPSTIDPRFLELTLFTDGMAVWFKDEEIGDLALQTMIGGQLNVYRIPITRKAYATNGYQRELNDTNSVIIFNNYLHTNSITPIQMYAQRLADLDRTIDVNAKAQKTPVLIQCDETERLTMKNLYEQYDGNAPFIFGAKSLNTKDITSLRTDAPYVSDKLYDLKSQIWNEALTYLGISNTNIVKKERMVRDEVVRNQGGTIASRYSRLEMRRQACEQINEMFGLDIWCDYREDFEDVDVTNESLEGVEDNE